MKIAGAQKSDRKLYSCKYGIARTSIPLADWLLTTPFDEHYTCIIPVKLSDYSRIVLYAFVDWLYGLQSLMGYA